MKEAQRVVTGWDEDGAPAVIHSGAPPTKVDFGHAQASELWVTSAEGEDLRSRVDAAAAEWQLEPPPGGTAFRLVTYQPGARIDLHTTNTLDYIVLVSGELTLILPSEEVTLAAGDTLVQRATAHGWANRSSEPCVIAAVLLDLGDESESR